METPPGITFPRPDPVVTEDFDWLVLTPETLTGDDYVYFALTAEGYEALSLNTADTARWIKEALSIIKAYERQVED